MASFPKSTYFRLQEKCERKPIPYDPDYPLVLFVLLSRWSLGIGIVAGFLHIQNRMSEVVKVSMILSLILILLATFFSIFHLSDRMRFMAMVKNLRSQVSWEILTTGAFMCVVTVNCLTLYFFNPTDLLSFILATVVTIFGLLTLAATGWAYKFISHPYWNTHILSVFYIVSGLVIGLSTIFWIGTTFFPSIAVHSLRKIPVILGILLILHFIMGLIYVKHVGPALKMNFKDRTGKNASLYLLFTFAFPLILIMWSIISHEGSILSSSLLLASLTIGIYCERILFFSIENPNYMFRILREKAS